MEKVLERILIDKSKVFEIETEIRFHEHLRRYASARRFCYGNVLDFASGCGYGSFILSKNPDVDSVQGIDKDEEAVAWANKEFSNEKVLFKAIDIESFSQKKDTLVSLEAVEHFQDKTLLTRLVNRCSIDNLIISYPDKKSTHFNPYHAHDFYKQDIISMFPDHILYHKYKMGDVQFLLFIRKPSKAPAHIFSYLADL